MAKFAYSAKRLVHGFGQKLEIFSFSFFLDHTGPEESFIMLWIENLLFKTIKILKWKSGKICIFAKGLVHGFGGKFELFFILLFFRSNTPKSVKREIENLLLYDKIVKYHRSGKILIFAKGLWFWFYGSWFWSKIWNFFLLCFFRSKKPIKSLMMFQTEN